MTYMTGSTEWLNAPEHGQGVPVIALHGSASSHAQWRSLVGWLQGHFRVITPDLPGYGGSVMFQTGEVPTLEEIARSLLPIVNAADTPVHMVGHSFGGAVALKFASMFPEKIRSLTLIEPASFNVLWAQDGAATPKTEGFIQAVRASHAGLEQGDEALSMQRFIDFWMGNGAWENSSIRVRKSMATKAQQVHRDFAALLMDQQSHWDASGVVCPVLCIRGQNSPIEMTEITNVLKKVVPFIRCEIIEDAGHMVPLTDPHIVDPMIGEFLAQVDLGWQSHPAIDRVAA